ncbi:AOX2 [[Candida] subhashii]|uniref:Alternative oxidase n=1 Tax=[Candida] subhashii TaxID=561895 RepID=A0A8J5QJ67_9ASCO|nr:AOX2 [[Candida] subhashii]KAG7661995.1 AOX2 [[Candida] subhashii]
MLTTTTTIQRRLPLVTSTFLRCSSTLVQPPPQTKPSKILDISTKIYAETDVAKHDDKKFITHALFPHPEFPQEECENVTYTHREPRTFGDKVSFRGIQFVRGTFDFVTGYKKSKTNDVHEFDGTRYEMTESKWLTRVIFLESIAGVPGAVASFIRHLHSLRLLKRDKAWIDTLLDEAYNERMHLLTFIKLGKPSWFTRSIIYAGQGVFANVFFLCYLANPKFCHRFVGYLEEEAVSTYTHLIHELDTPGKLSKFNYVKLPEIAIKYWPELNEKSTFRDLILRIRADEAKHREVNHTLANLNQKEDRNPFALQLKDANPQPNHGLKVMRPTGWEKEELKL